MSAEQNVMITKTSVDPLAFLEHVAAIGEPIWLGAVDAAVEARNSMDMNRWLLGDLCNLIERKHGADSIGKFASDIKMERASTLRSYWRVSKFYDSSPRGAFPNLSWSHFREAMRVEDQDEAIEWLEKASAGDWPVAELSKQLKAALGEDEDTKPDDKVVILADSVLLDTPGARVRLFNPSSGELTLIVNDISSVQAFTDFWKRDKPLMRLMLTQEAL